MRLAFARAIAAEDEATYYDRDGLNHPAPEPVVTLETAVRSGRPYFLKQIAAEVLPIDGDPKDFARRAGHARVETADVAACDAAAVAFFAACTAAGLRPVLVASGSPGGRHVFCRVANPVTRTRLAAEAKALGLDVRGQLGSGGIRPPLTPHRSHDPKRHRYCTSAILEPTHRSGTPDARQALARLLSRPAARARSLPEWADALLLDGHTARRTYRNGSGMVMALVTAMLQAGWSRPRIERALRDRANRGAAKLHAIQTGRGEGAARRYLAALIAKATDWLATSPATAAPSPSTADARVKIAALRRRVETMPFKGRGGASRRAVLLVHLEIADKAGTTTGYETDRRTVAELAGVNGATATRAQDWWQTQGWLRAGTRGRGTLASSWTLTLSAANVTHCTNPLRPPDVPPGQRIGAVSNVWLDVFTNAPGGLGLSTGRVFEALEVDAPVTIAVLAARFRLQPQSVRKQLHRLEAHGLAIRDGRCWCRGVREPADVAAELGTLGTTTRRQDEHNADRATYRAALPPRAADDEAAAVPVQRSFRLRVVPREDRKEPAPGAPESSGPALHQEPAVDARGPSPAGIETIPETPDLWHDDG